MSKPSDLIHGTLDLLILNTISLQPQHAGRSPSGIQQVSLEVLRSARERCTPLCIGWSSIGTAIIFDGNLVPVVRLPDLASTGPRFHREMEVLLVKEPLLPDTDAADVEVTKRPALVHRVQLCRSAAADGTHIGLASKWRTSPSFRYNAPRPAGSTLRSLPHRFVP
jgi:hypothetical protein